MVFGYILTTQWDLLTITGPRGWNRCLVREGEPTTQSWPQGCSLAQQAVITTFRATLLAAAGPALHAPHGCYLDSCPQNHEQNSRINALSIRNITAVAAIARWLSGQSGATVVDDPFPSAVSKC